MQVKHYILGSKSDIYIRQVMTMVPVIGGGKGGGIKAPPTLKLKEGLSLFLLCGLKCML